MILPLRILIALAMSLIAATAGAQAAGAFASDHMLNTLKIQECRQRYELGMLKASSGEISAMDAYRTYLQCKSEARDQVSNTYSRMTTKLKSKSQKAALKEYRIAVNLALEGSEPKDGELKFQYKARLARLDEDVERAWQRLKLE